MIGQIISAFQVSRPIFLKQGFCQHLFSGGRELQGGRSSTSRTKPLIQRFLTSLILLFFLFFAVRMFLAFLVTRHPAHFLLMISEGLVVALLLIRRPSQEIAKTPFAWMVAGIGTFGPLLVTPTDVSLLPWSIMIWLNLIGTLIVIAAKGSLGRSFGIVAANRGIKVGGLYQLVCNALSNTRGRGHPLEGSRVRILCSQHSISVDSGILLKTWTYRRS